MITKRQFIELIQNRLSGGDTPQDVRRLYDREIIARVLNLAFADIVTTNSDAASEVAIEYTFEPTSDSSGYYITLSPMPISGTFGIFSVSDEKGDFIVQDKVMAKSLTSLKGANKNAAILFNNKLRFNRTPVGSVSVLQVPNIYQMKDDDILVVPMNASNNFGEIQLLNLCVQVMMNPQYQDDLNNNSIDAQNGRA